MKIAKTRDLLLQWETLDAKMAALMDDYTEEGWELFAALCEKRDAIGDKIQAQLATVGIDNMTSRAMLLVHRERMKELFARWDGIE